MIPRQSNAKSAFGGQTNQSIPQNEFKRCRGGRGNAEQDDFFSSGIDGVTHFAALIADLNGLDRGSLLDGIKHRSVFSNHRQGTVLLDRNLGIGNRKGGRKNQHP